MMSRWRPYVKQKRGGGTSVQHLAITSVYGNATGLEPGGFGKPLIIVVEQNADSNSDAWKYSLESRTWDWESEPFFLPAIYYSL